MFWTYPEPAADRLLFNGLWSGWILIACRLEERDLIADFGDAYILYRKKVPMLIPWKIPR
jgi:protein-S-isoprenylcysteine O-methyltransferase Ste14